MPELKTEIISMLAALLVVVAAAMLMYPLR